MSSFPRNWLEKACCPHGKPFATYTEAVHATVCEHLTPFLLTLQGPTPRLGRPMGQLHLILRLM